jgi:hypothetical protein
MNLSELFALAIGVFAFQLHSLHTMPPASATCSVYPAAHEVPRYGTVPWIRKIVRASDAVVRVTAIGSDSIPPAAADDRLDTVWSGYRPHYYPAVRFKVDEVIHGSSLPMFLRLQGGTDSTDDFNHQKVPYTSVRSSGLHGSCYAFGYRLGGHYLLLLRRDPESLWHLRRVALAPVNEQVRGPNDPWVRWVRTLFSDRSH